MLTARDWIIKVFVFPCAYSCMSLKTMQFFVMMSELLEMWEFCGDTLLLCYRKDVEKSLLIQIR